MSYVSLMLFCYCSKIWLQCSVFLVFSNIVVVELLLFEKRPNVLDFFKFSNNRT